MKFAAIDVGSNAVRLLFSRVYEGEGVPFFKKELLVRMPLRLGDDAFSRKRISDPKAERLMETMLGFAHLIRGYRPVASRAAATSAMRTVENGPEIVQAIEERTGIRLEILDGSDEAKMILANNLEERLNLKKSYLYVDVGGGSTELSIFAKGKVRSSASFDIGTVRLLRDLVPKKRWDEMKRWIADHAKKHKVTAAIGSGGNINKIFRLAHRKEKEVLAYQNIKKISNTLQKYTYEERIRKFNLKSDRADVILPASRIYLSVMKWAGTKRMHVPQVGLADGLVHVLYEEQKRKE